MSKYPNLEKLNIPIITDSSVGFPVVRAIAVEELFEKAKVGYGFAGGDSGSFTYGPGLGPSGMEKQCLIVNVEDTKEETAESIAKQMEELMPNFLQSAEGVQKLKAMAEKLCAKVLR